MDRHEVAANWPAVSFFAPALGQGCLVEFYAASDALVLSTPATAPTSAATTATTAATFARPVLILRILAALVPTVVLAPLATVVLTLLALTLLVLALLVLAATIAAASVTGCPALPVVALAVGSRLRCRGGARVAYLRLLLSAVVVLLV
jgi:uncharacterized membrane protein